MVYVMERFLMLYRKYCGMRHVSFPAAFIFYHCLKFVKAIVVSLATLAGARSK